MIDNESPCLVPESKPKITPMTGVYRHMQIGVLEIQRHHPPTLVKLLQNRGEGLHAELGGTCGTQINEWSPHTSRMGWNPPVRLVARK